MVILEEPTCLAMGEENDERIVSMASHSLLHNGNVTRTGATTSPMSHLAATPDGYHQNISNHPRGSARNEDDELTSLSWLQDTNLLRNIHVGVPQEEPEEEDYEEDLSHSPFSDDCHEEEEREEESAIQTGADKEGLPYGHITYNPRVHVSAKPPYSFSCLIFMAIEDTLNKALPVKDIYAWIVRHFPYYQNAPTGWKNSVRHNLSLNKCFRKVEKDKGQNVGKGSLWCIDPEFRPNLLQTLKKAPQCPFSQLEDVPLSMTRMPKGQSSTLKTEIENDQMELDANESSQGVNLSHSNIPSPDLFPYLAKRLSVSTVKSSEVDAAATMLALKNGVSNPSNMSKVSSEEESTNKTKLKMKRKKKNHRFRNSPGYKHESATSVQPPQAHRKPFPKPPTAPSPPASTVPIITSSPSEDHTYSASPSQPSSNSGSDNSSRGGSPAPSTEERRNNGTTAAEEEEARLAKEEERSLEEGAQALLSLAKNSLWIDPKRTLVFLQAASSER